MLDRTRKLITGTLLTFFAAMMLLLFSSTQAMANALTLADTANSIVTETNNTVAANTVNGTTGSNMVFTDAGGTELLKVTITGAGTVSIGELTSTQNDACDTSTVDLGNGAADTVMIIAGNVVGRSPAEAAAGVDININVKAVDGSAAGNTTLKMYGTVDSFTDVTLTGDANGVATLQVGDGVTGVIGEGVAASPNPTLGWVGSLSYFEGTKGYWFISVDGFDFTYNSPNGLTRTYQVSVVNNNVPLGFELVNNASSVVNYINEIIN